jgi:beta-glucosidase-like glycosyl hydrolase
MSPEIYRHEVAIAGIKAVTISDDLQAGALTNVLHPALHAINAGLDLAMYAQTPEAAEEAYEKLEADLRAGTLSTQRVREAGTAIASLKAALRR